MQLSKEEIEELDRRGNLFDGHVTIGSSQEVQKYVIELLGNAIKRFLDEGGVI